MRRCLSILLALLVLALPARGQYASARQPSFSAAQLIAPAVFGASGLALHYFGHDAVEVPVRDYFRGLDMTYTDVGKPLVYCALPALHLGLGLIGVPSRLSFGDRALECAIAYLFSYSTGFVAKRVFSSVRPDGSDARSFPSGHSTLGFTGATLICIDYGPLVAAVPYLVCGFTMAERLWGDRHWLGDLFAGAGLGILCAHAGQWLVGPVKSLFGLPEWTWDGLGGRRGEFALLPSADPFSGTPMMSFSLRF